MARKEHVARIFGLEKSGDPKNPTKLDDTYLDMRRADELEFVDPGTGQVTLEQIVWEDGYGGVKPDDADRKIRIEKLTNPTDPPANKDDPDRWIPVPVLDALTVGGFLRGPLYSLVHSDQDISQENVLSFLNDPDTDVSDLSREVRPLRITFAETPDLDERLKDGPIALDDYQRNEDTRDTDQYVDAELVDSYEVRNHDQVTVVELDHGGDERLEPFEPTPDDRPQAPLRLDPRQYPINIKWETDVWALVWVNKSGLASVTQITVADWEGNPAGTAVEITTNAEILYERNEVITDDPPIFGQTFGSVLHAKIVYGSFNIDDANATYNYKIADGLTIPIPALFDGSTYVGPFASVFNADDPADMVLYAAMVSDTTIAGTFLGTQDATITTPKVEAVWLLEWKGAAARNRQFTISTSGFGAAISIWLYPKSYLKVDAVNKKYGIFGIGQEPDTIDAASGNPATNPYQRVYFPINWKKPPPPYPKSPGGRDWPWPPGNAMLSSADAQDVINTALFETDCGFDGADPSWSFQVEKRNHWNAEPAAPIDPTLRDKIWQVWPTDVDPPADPGNTRNDWGVARYTMKPFGEAFSPDASWQQVETGPGTFDSPLSPLPLIAPETAG